VTDCIGCPLGVCVLPLPGPSVGRTVSYPDYIHEILEHAGLCYALVEPATLVDRLPELRVLVTVGGADLPDDVRQRVPSWVKNGGSWLAIGGTGALPELFGVEPERPAFEGWGMSLAVLGEGYLVPTVSSHPVLAGVCGPLHYFGGAAFGCRGGQALAHALDAHQRTAERPVVVEARPGKGHCLLVAPDVTGTIVRIQQGIAVTRDGVSAPDGTCTLVDGALKSGDGQVLDWLLDRQPVPGVPGLRAFLRCIADEWRDLIVRAMLHLAAEAGVALPVLWYHPRDLPAVGHLSHDTDLGEVPNADRLLEILGSLDLSSTWCVIPPGYAAEAIARIRDAGHELAMHFDAFERPHFTEEALESQWRELSALFGLRPVSNKNHYLRFEGDTEFFDWLAARGIALDQSKGAARAGEAGYNFGTCHLFRPVAPDGRTIGVLELATPTQDLEVFAPSALGDALLSSVMRHHGVLHLLFHPAHIMTDGVEDALRGAVERGRARGLEWWTAERLAHWELARRGLRWASYETRGNGLRVTVTAEQPLEGATVLWLGEREGPTVERWGFRFSRTIADLDGEVVLRP